MRKRVRLVAVMLALAGCGGPAGPPKAVFDLSSVTPAVETYGDADLQHLRFLLTEIQQQEYLSLPPGEPRAEFMRIVWAQLDPTPTTVLNERKDEHYRRLAYVRRHFAIDEDPGWDRRGELLLRYGSPDRRESEPADVVEGVGLVPPKETWIYAGLGQAYVLEDTSLEDNFRDSYDLSPDFDTTSPRDIQDSRYALDRTRDLVALDQQARLDDIEDPEEALRRQQLETMLTRGQEAYREAPQSYRHDYGGEQLEFVFDVVNFAASTAGRTRVEVNTAFWAGDLRYVPEGSGWSAVLTIQALVRTLDYRDVTGKERVTRDRKESIENLEGRLVLDQVGFDLDPGRYRLALSVQDSTSGNVGIYKTEFQVRSFPEGQLRISDIQRALDVRGGQPEDPFLRGPYQVVPYPLGTFPRDHDVYLFFEIYGLELSPEGDCFYGVDFLIKPRMGAPASWFGSSKGRLVPGVASTFEGTGRSSTVAEYIILDPTTLTDDVYDVDITVHDRIDDRTAEGTITFAVQSR